MRTIPATPSSLIHSRPHRVPLPGENPFLCLGEMRSPVSSSLHTFPAISALEISSFQKMESEQLLRRPCWTFSRYAGMVIDLRRHEGGDSAAASLLASHFFDTELVHVDAEYGPMHVVSAPFWYRPCGLRYVGPAVYVSLGKRTLAWRLISRHAPGRGSRDSCG